MPAFKRFGPDDQVDNVLVLEPQYDLASGNLGWHGSPEGSASLSLYGGMRRSLAGIFTDIQYQSLYPAAGQTGRPTRGQPLTASINLVYMTNEDLSLTQRSSTRWGNEHWATVQRLYQDYKARDPDYVTGSYDYYCLYFQSDSGNALVFNAPNSYTQPTVLTASFTIEAWVKPFMTASTSHDFTIASMNRIFWFGITGSSGMLLLSSSYGSFTASAGPAANRWSHVAMSYDATTQTGSFKINMADVGSFGQATFSSSLGTFLSDFTVGNQISGTVAQDPTFGQLQLRTNMRGLPNRSFHGLIGETRLWYVARSVTQLSSSMRVSLTSSSPSLFGSVIRTRLNDGPLTTFPTDQSCTPPENPDSSPAIGSGTIDVAAVERLNANVETVSTPKIWGYMVSFDDRVGPVWHPNDNVNFTPAKTRAGPQLLNPTPNLIKSLQVVTSGLTGSGYQPVKRMLVVDVPSAFYGRQIVPGSVMLTDRTYSSGSYGLVRVIIDDARGGLFISGSVCSSSFGNKEDYRGVEWNKVGNVFYGEGLIVIKDPSLLDMWRSDGATTDPNDLVQLSFRGHSRIPVKTLMCRIDRGDVNCTSNQTFWSTDDDGRRIRRHTSGSLRASTIGVYNSQRELVGVARLAEPLRIRSRDRLNIKLRFDF